MSSKRLKKSYASCCSSSGLYIKRKVSNTLSAFATLQLNGALSWYLESNTFCRWANFSTVLSGPSLSAKVEFEITCSILKKAGQANSDCRHTFIKQFIFLVLQNPFEILSKWVILKSKSFVRNRRTSFFTRWFWSGAIAFTIFLLPFFTTGFRSSKSQDIDSFVMSKAGGLASSYTWALTSSTTSATASTIFSAFSGFNSASF